MTDPIIGPQSSALLSSEYGRAHVDYGDVSGTCEFLYGYLIAEDRRVFTAPMILRVLTELETTGVLPAVSPHLSRPPGACGVVRCRQCIPAPPAADAAADVVAVFEPEEEGFWTRVKRFMLGVWTS